MLPLNRSQSSLAFKLGELPKDIADQAINLVPSQVLKAKGQAMHVGILLVFYVDRGYGNGLGFIVFSPEGKEIVYDMQVA